MLYGVVLSAGGSERMGGFPKALLRINNRYFIEHIISEIASVQDIGKIYVVLGYKSKEIIKNTDINKNSIEVLINKHWKTGQLSSLRIAIKNTPEDTTGILFTLVDHPLVKNATYRLLVEKHQKHSDRIIIPTYRGRKGHPTVFPRRLFPTLLGEELPGGARDLIYREAKNVIFVPVEDEGTVIDIDTEEDYQRYISNRH